MEEVREDFILDNFLDQKGTTVLVPDENGMLWKGLLDAFDDDDDELSAGIYIAMKALKHFIRLGWNGIKTSNKELPEDMQFNVFDCNQMICLWMLLKIQRKDICESVSNSVIALPTKIKAVRDKIYDLFWYDNEYAYREFHPEEPGWIRFCKVEKLVRQFVRKKPLTVESKAAEKIESEQKEVVDEIYTEKQKDIELLKERKPIFEQLIGLVAKGEWVEPANVDNMTQMIKNVLGVGIQPEASDSKGVEALWSMLEKGRGDRVRVVWLNMVGYFVSKGLLKGGSPALCKQFFGDESGYTNIDKGRNERSNAFAEVVPLLEKYMPKK